MFIARFLLTYPGFVDARSVLIGMQNLVLQVENASEDMRSARPAYIVFLPFSFLVQPSV